MAESVEELKSLFMRVKQEGEKAGLKLNIQKTKIVASSPITSWPIEGGKVKAVTDFIFLGSKITADSDCSHEIKRCLLLEGKAMSNLDSVLKTRDITLMTNVHIVKAMIFPVVMYEYESWTIRKAESWRIDAFKLWCWRRLFRVSWTARRSNQSILREINPEYSLEELMLKLKLQCLSHLKSLLIGKDPEAEKDWRQKKEGAAEDEMVRKHFYSIDINLSKLKDSREQRSLACYSTQSCKESDDLVTERQQHGLNCVLLPQIHWLKS